jgi:biotin carboxyl carrier protein
MKKYTITVNGTAYEVEVEDMGGAVASAPKAAAPKAAPAPAAAPAPKAAAPAPAAKPVAAGAATISAPMPGKVLEVKVKVGDAVKAGDVIMVLEAMKMQNEIMAPADGTISRIRRPDCWYRRRYDRNVIYLNITGHN